MSETQILSIHPILTSYDIDATEAFYRDKLNFTTLAKFDTYLVMGRGKMNFHFQHLAQGSPATTMTQAYIYVENIDALYAEITAADAVHPNGKLEIKGYGMKQFTLQDVDNNAIHFGENIESA